MQFGDALEKPKKMSREGTRVCLGVIIKTAEINLDLMGIVIKVCGQKF